MTIHAQLSLHQLQLMVHLGFGDEERQISQRVWLDIDIYFARLPEAAQHDGQGFLCYDALSAHLQQAVSNRQFQLIEYLCPCLGQSLQQWLDTQNTHMPDNTTYFTLRLRKPDAPVDALLGGASFTYTTLPQGLI